MFVLIFYSHKYCAKNNVASYLVRQNNIARLFLSIFAHNIKLSFVQIFFRPQQMGTRPRCPFFYVSQKFVSQFSQQIFKTFHIETADRTIQYLNCVFGKIVLKSNDCLVNLLTVLQILILVFCPKCRFLFLHVKRFHKFSRNIFIGAEVSLVFFFNNLWHPSIFKDIYF